MELDLSDARLILCEDVIADPRPMYDVLRRDAPVWRIPGQDSYLVSDPALVREAVGRPEDFSSNLVSVLHDDGTGCPVPFGMGPYGDPIHVLPTADPPRHTGHRRLLQPHFSPEAVAGLEPAVTDIVVEHIEPLLDAGPVDLVSSFSDPVPARVVCELIGLPAADARRLVGLVVTTGGLLDGVTDMDGMVEAAGAALELTAYVQEQLDKALRRPDEERLGLLRMFAGAVESGDLSAAEARDILVVLVAAGSETTASLIATAVRTLACDTALQEEMRTDPDRIPEWIEEVLRTDGPFQFHYRWTPHDTQLGGVDIPAQSRVLLMWAAANRPAPSSPDESAHTETRSPGRHFAFGRGLHFCIGAPVARLEARIAVEQLLARTTSVMLVPDDPPEHRPSIFIRRHARLPVALTTATGS